MTRKSTAEEGKRISLNSDVLFLIKKQKTYEGVLFYERRPGDEDREHRDALCDVQT